MLRTAETLVVVSFCSKILFVVCRAEDDLVINWERFGRQYSFTLGAFKTTLVVDPFVHLQSLHGVDGFLTRPALLHLDGGPHALAPAHLFYKK